MKLFEVPPEEQTKDKCKSCKYFDWIEYYSGKKFFYCNAIYSGRTQNKKLKIKANQKACDIYKDGSKNNSKV